MKTFYKLSIATAFIACVSFNTSAANKNDSEALLSIVKSSVDQSLTDANRSIDIGLQKSILTNVHNLAFGDNDAPKGQVKIIDLVSNKQTEESESPKNHESTKAE